VAANTMLGRHLIGHHELSGNGPAPTWNLRTRSKAVQVQNRRFAIRNGRFDDMSQEAIPFHLLAKPAGATCNLDCKYCFFLSKDQLYPNERTRMTDEVLEAYIQQRLSQHNEPEINIAWQGGEPTIMGLDFFKRSVALVAKHRKPKQKILYTIQTNGLLLDNEWCAFLKEHNFLVGLSNGSYRRPAGDEGRPAVHVDVRVRMLCDRNLVDDLRHQGLGFLATVVATNFSRRWANVRYHPNQ
jgi:hypothetical protein